MPGKPNGELITPHAMAFYQEVIGCLNDARASYLVGGAYALGPYTGIERHTKDFDIFVRARDYPGVMRQLETVGCTTELAFPHWLGKAFRGEEFIDVIFSSGNAIAAVDDEWLLHAVPAEVFGMPVRLCPVEETIWSKAFIMERERFDGADILHLLRARGAYLDWERLLRRFGADWRVLFTHLLMFGYVYPAERATIPRWLMDELQARLQRELHEQPAAERVCRGTILSREQYLTDVASWGYRDARLAPGGRMSAEDIALWTEAIGRRVDLSFPSPDAPRT